MVNKGSPRLQSIGIGVVALGLLLTNATATLLSSGASILGCLIALDRPAGFLPLVAGVGAGLLVGSGLLLATTLRKLPTSLISPTTGAAAWAAAVLFAGIGLNAPNEGFGLCFAIAGIAYGIGGIALIARWRDLLAFLAPTAVLATVSWALALASLIAIACFSFASTAVMLGMNVLTPLGGCALTLRARSRRRDDEAAAPTHSSGAPALWPPLGGALICCVVLGFTCGTPHPADGFVHAETISRGVFLGFALCSGMLGLVALALPQPSRLRTVFSALCPIMAALPSIPCFAPVQPDGVVGTVLGVLTGVGFAFFATLTGWHLYAFTGPLQADKEHCASAARRWSLSIVLATVALGGGIFASPLLSDLAKTTVSLTLFVGYLVALATVAFAQGSARSGAPTAPAPEDSGEDREAPAVDPLDARCAQLSEQHGLSPRESEVLGLLARGRTATYIAGELYVSKETVKVHVRHIYEKLGVHSRTELLDLFQR